MKIFGVSITGVKTPCAFTSYEWELSYFCALCRRLQGNYSDAVETLKRLYHSANRNIGAAWWIARFLLEQGKFSEAASWLRTEMKSEYLPREDWQLSAAIALAEFADNDLQVDAFDRQLRSGNPGLHQIILGLSNQFCPELSRLSENSQKYWIQTVALLHVEPLFEFAREVDYAKAVTNVAVISEYEIKRYVFLTFAERMKNPGFAAVVRDDRKDHFSDKLLTFLAKGKDGTIDLKGIREVILECQNPAMKTFEQFRQHLTNVAPALVDQSDNIRELVDLRNPPSHEPRLYSRETALRAAELCLTLIRCLKDAPAPAESQPRERRPS